MVSWKDKIRFLSIWKGGGRGGGRKRTADAAAAGRHRLTEDASHALFVPLVPPHPPIRESVLYSTYM